jgi:hypothetical protein
LYLAAAYTAIFPLVFGFMKMPTEMGLALVTGCLLLAFLNLEKFESFKGAGFEATIRRAVDEAYATIERLQNIAASLAEPIVVSITMEGRMFQYIPNEAKLEQIKDIEKTLSAVGLSTDKVIGITKFFYSVIENDHVKKILYQISNETSVPTSLRDSAKLLQESMPENFNIIQHLADSGWTPNGETSELLADLQFFKDKHSFRRIEKWQ